MKPSLAVYPLFCTSKEYTPGSITGQAIAPYVTASTPHGALPRDQAVAGNASTEAAQHSVPGCSLLQPLQDRCRQASTLTGSTRQMSSQYWRMARSEEKKPQRAAFRIDMRVQRSGSR